jgi:HSP90 family molecular chaperone
VNLSQGTVATGSTVKTTSPHPQRVFSTSSPLDSGDSFEFQAETKQLLDIVTHSLYTDKEVFLRELISNASDALEKLRHLQVANDASTQLVDKEHPLEIRIETNELDGTLTISDSGIGMNKEEMVNHLGTIARSGSKAFVEQVKSSAEDGGSVEDASRGIIGKFGVGFYSSFMVGDKVEVRSKCVYFTQYYVSIVQSHKPHHYIFISTSDTNV